MNNPIGDTLPPKDDQKPAGSEGITPPEKVVPPDPVEELKNQVARETARAATAQQEADTAQKSLRNEKILRIAAEKKLKVLAAGGNGDTPPAAGTVNAEDSEAEMERLNAEKGIANLLMMTPEYQALLQKDATLKEVLLNNPLSLITEYIDAGDAVDQIKKKLDARITAATTPPGGTPPAGGDGKPTPKAGEVPPPASNSVEMKGNISPQAAVKMSPAEWAKLPEEQRRKMLLGEF